MLIYWKVTTKITKTYYLSDWSSKNDASMGFDQGRVDFMELDQHREWNQPYNEIS